MQKNTEDNELFRLIRLYHNNSEFAKRQRGKMLGLDKPMNSAESAFWHFLEEACIAILGDNLNYSARNIKAADILLSFGEDKDFDRGFINRANQLDKVLDLYLKAMQEAPKMIIYGLR